MSAAAVGGGESNDLDALPLQQLAPRLLNTESSSTLPVDSEPLPLLSELPAKLPRRRDSDFVQVLGACNRLMALSEVDENFNSVALQLTNPKSPVRSSTIPTASRLSIRSTPKPPTLPPGYPDLDLEAEFRKLDSAAASASTTGTPVSTLSSNSPDSKHHRKVRTSSSAPHILVWPHILLSADSSPQEEGVSFQGSARGTAGFRHNSPTPKIEGWPRATWPLHRKES